MIRSVDIPWFCFIIIIFHCLAHTLSNLSHLSGSSREINLHIVSLHKVLFYAFWTRVLLVLWDGFVCIFTSLLTSDHVICYVVSNFNLLNWITDWPKLEHGLLSFGAGGTLSQGLWGLIKDRSCLIGKLKCLNAHGAHHFLAFGRGRLW